MLTRCPACSCDFPIIPGDGPPRSPYVFVGERPGFDESFNSLRPFTGHAGREFNYHYLQLAGLERDGGSVYITNTVKCFAAGNRKPSDWEVEACSLHHLKGEIEHHDPELVILMGGTALSLVPELDLETHHGIPQWVELFGVMRWVLPTYHPALGLHSPKAIRDLISDFKALGRVIEEGPESVIPADDHAGMENYELLTRDYDDYFLPPSDQRPWLGVDTEADSHGHLWSVQLSQQPGTGYMIRADDPMGMQWAQRMLFRYPVLYVHNAVYDEESALRGGLIIPHENVIDTMQLAYHAGYPQGLKPNAYRMHGMKMQDFEELVLPYSRTEMLEWGMGALGVIDEMRAGMLTGRQKKLKPHPIHTEVNRIVNSVVKNPKYNPWKRWELVKARAGMEGSSEKEDVLGAFAYWVEEQVGRMPKAGIERVPIKEAVWYGCRDADAGLRTGFTLEEVCAGVGVEVAERDWDQVDYD